MKFPKAKESRIVAENSQPDFKEHLRDKLIDAAEGGQFDLTWYGVYLNSEFYFPRKKLAKEIIRELRTAGYKAGMLWGVSGAIKITW